jgi:hypothetical protein
MVREFFASLSRSERLRMYDFFKSRISSKKAPGSGSVPEPRFVRKREREYRSNRQSCRATPARHGRSGPLPIVQRGDNPALGQLDTRFDTGLVARLVGGSGFRSGCGANAISRAIPV